MADEIGALIEEIIVDAYGDDEQLSSFRQWFEDRGVFPFAATVVGAEVQVIEVDYRGDDRRGLVARVTRDGDEHCISLLDITASRSVTPDTADLLAAYRRWANPDALEGA